MATPASGTPVPPPPSIDFRSNPEAVRVVTEAERLSFGHLVNLTFAVDTARIAPLPHQRIAVSQHLLPQVRLRFLLADDAGAGKTIMAGLYIREMLAHQLLQALIELAPAGGEEMAFMESISNHVAARGADKPTTPGLFGDDMFTESEAATDAP